jgi:predicted nucleic acid-binding protein
MAVYFCDTSAIVKRYINEPGTTWLVGVTDRAAGNRVLVAGITAVEAVAAITRKQRGGGLTLTDAAAAIAAFRHDYANEFGVVAIAPKLITLAMSTAEKHGLRGYDAMQLAAALLTHERRQASKLTPLTLLSADGELNAAAMAEGLTVDDPNAHP